MTVQLGAEVKNWLLGDFYRLAKENPETRLVVFVWPENVAEYRAQFAHERCIIEPLAKPPYRPLRQMFRTASYVNVPSSTIWGRTRHRRLEGGSLPAFWGKRLVWLLSYLKVWRSFMRTLEKFFSRDEKVWKEYFEKYRPAAHLAPTTYREVDFALIKYAKKVGVPTLGMLRGWDNMSSKAFLLAHPDMLLVQNPLMRDEAINWNDVSREKVRVIGFPYFDHYFDSQWRMTRDEVARSIGADPRKKWIAYFAGGMMTGFLYDKKTHDHLLMLKDALERGEFGEAEVMVSVHPSNRAEWTGDDLGEKIKILRLVKNWTFTHDSAKIIMNFIRECELVIDLGSSLALEAAIFDKPIIFAGFNGYQDEKLPSHRKLSTIYDYTVHMQYLIRTGGVWVVETEEELIRAVKTYLANPSLHREGRSRIVKEVVGPLDGKAGQRAFDALIKLS